MAVIYDTRQPGALKLLIETSGCASYTTFNIHSHVVHIFTTAQTHTHTHAHTHRHTDTHAHARVRAHTTAADEDAKIKKW